MKTYISLLCISLPLFCFAEVDQRALIQSVAEKIAASKPAVDDQTPTEASYEVTRKQVEEEIAKTLPQWDAAEGMEKAIAQWFKASPAEIKLIAGGGAEGQSGNSLYTYQSTVIKVFKEGKGEFVDELLALTTFKNLHLKHFFVPGVLAIGRASAENQHHLLIVEEFAPGYPLYKPLRAIFELPAGSPERQELFDRFLIGLNALGKALAELHTAGHPVTKPMLPCVQEAYLLDAEKGTKGFVKKDPGHAALAAQTLTAFQNGLKERGAKPFGYMHSDAHLGNYIWDEEHKKLSIIDVTESGVSVGKDFKPIGTPMLDFVRILTEINYWSHWGLTPEETKQMQESYLDGYRSINPAFSENSPEVPLFQMINAYRYFAWSTELNDQLSAELKEHIAPLWPLYIQVMEKLTHH